MNILTNHENGLAQIAISGPITSANSDELEKTLKNVPSNEGIIIDAAELEYISSAGLRVLLTAKRRSKDMPFRIINVSNEVKNIFDMTGFSEIMDISGAVRQINVDGCKKIGAGACGEVFRLDDETIIKLYYPHIRKEDIEKEKALSKKAFVMGVPTAISYDIVEADGRTGVVYELLNSKTLSELIRSDTENIDRYVDIYVETCKKVHAIDGSSAGLADFKEINRADILNVTGITDEERTYLYKLLDMIPDRSTCVHGDLNINNIMVQNGEICLIDMGEFSVGTPIFDISRIVFSMELAAPGSDKFNDFYKMPQSTVDKILKLFLQKYFGCKTIDEAMEKDPDVKWLYPLAWLRTCASMLNGNRWGEENRVYAMSLLRNKLIPFIKSEC